MRYYFYTHRETKEIVDFNEKEAYRPRNNPRVFEYIGWAPDDELVKLTDKFRKLSKSKKVGDVAVQTLTKAQHKNRAKQLEQVRENMIKLAQEQKELPPDFSKRIFGSVPLAARSRIDAMGLKDG